MKYRIGRILIPILIVSSLGCIITFLSSRIESQMELAATGNVRELVQVIESGIAEIRRNDVAAARRLPEFYSSDEEVSGLLRRMQKGSPFARVSFVPAGAESGVSDQGDTFLANQVPEWDNSVTEETRISSVYMSDLGAWTYTIQCPVYEEEEYTGDLYADVIMERYDDILPDSIYQSDGLIYILDADSLRFIYEPTSTEVIISGKYDLHSFLNDFGILDQELEQHISSAIAGRSSTIVKMVVDEESSYIYFF